MSVAAVASPGSPASPPSNSRELIAQPESPSEEEKQFLQQAEENETTIRELQFRLGRVEDLRRAAVKETNLVREIKSINMLTQRKVESGASVSGQLTADGTPLKRKNQLPLAPETRAQIIALEDAMRNESRRTHELQEESRLVDTQTQKVEKEVAHVDAQLSIAEKATGRSRTGGVGYHEANLENVIGRLKQSLAVLDEEQRTTFAITTKLTQQIDELGAELEAMSEVDKLLAEAKETLVLKSREHELMTEEINRQNRIAQKKEKAISSFSLEKDLSEFKRLENDKKMLHVEFQKSHEARRVAARAVEVNAVALRRIEAQLGGISQALSLVFLQASEDVQPDQRAAAHPVPIGEFEDVQKSLDECRKLIAAKDKQVEQIDAEIEALERKVDIVQVAQQSRQSAAYLDIRNLCRERDDLRSHLAQTDVEFKGARTRLAQENELLERHVQSS